MPEERARLRVHLGPERGVVWVGDVLRALAALRPADAEARRAMGEALGFRVRGASVTDAAVPTQPEPLPDLAEPVAARERPAPILEILEPVEYAPVAGQRLGTVEALAALVAEHLETAPPFTPLLRPEWSPGIVAAANETIVRDGPIDVEAMVDSAARLELAESVPRRPRASLHRGVQLLVDIGDGMQPFRRDQLELVEAVRSIAGKHSTEVLYFRDCPTRDEGAGPGGVWTWRRYRLPEPRRPVLVLTDFGIGGPQLRAAGGTVDEWVRVALLLARRESRLSAFVPYASDRWPPALRAVAHLVTWDRGTSRTAVRHALRHSA